MGQKQKQNPSVAGSRPRPRDAAETRKRILHTATALFLESTYENVGTRDIAAAAGVNATLINRYFGSKKELFAEVILSMSDLFDDVGTPEQLEEKIILSLSGVLSEGSFGPKTAKLRLIMTSALSPNVSDIISEFFQKLTAKMAAIFPDGMQKAKADLLLSSVLGILMFFRILRDNDAWDPDDAELLASFRHMVAVFFEKPS